MFDSKNSESILAFIYDLQLIELDFPISVIELLTKHFGYDKLIFSPDDSNNGQKAAAANFYASGLNRDRLQLYANHYHKEDIFRRANLPPSLQEAEVLSVQDIMPYSEFLQTQYCKFLGYTDVCYEICLFLSFNGKRLGTIGIFRTGEEGDFSPLDRWRSEIICRYISLAYKKIIDSSCDKNELERFRRANEYLPVGMIVFDSNFELQDCNSLAKDYCNDIFVTEKAALSYVGSGNKGSLHGLIPHLRQQLLDTKNTCCSFELKSRNSLYYFYLTTFFSSGSIVGIQTFYLISISIKSDLETPPIAEVSFGLTRREEEVAALISQGCTNKQIAGRMFISSHTVKAHIMKIFSKTGVKSRTELLCRLAGKI